MHSLLLAVPLRRDQVYAWGDTIRLLPEGWHFPPIDFHDFMHIYLDPLNVHSNNKFAITLLPLGHK